MADHKSEFQYGFKTKGRELMLCNSLNAIRTTPECVMKEPSGQENRNGNNTKGQEMF